VRAALDRVKKGQPLLELYVPDWIAVQEDYLTARQLQGNGLETLAQSARQRMRQAGMSEMQIALVERSGQVQARVTLTAPVSGIITDLMVREGSTVMTGDPLMGINDLSSVWVHAEVPESQATQILTGANVIAQTPAWPSKIFRGEVQSLLPEVSPTTRTRKARMLLVNTKEKLVPGMFVQMQLSTGIPQEALLIPSEALVRTGKRTLVMLVDNGAFRPVEVKVRREQHYKTEVLSGLLLGQEVVVSGQFLIDSEASLKGVEARLSSDKESAPVDASAMPQLYHTTARVEAVSDSTVTLTHPDIPALKWPGMTMDFLLAPDVSRKLLVGEEISIEFLIPEGDAPHIVRWQTNNAAQGDIQ
jgi:Cu(I)/Ag(I) efflux system membrane fusion protein